LRHVSRWAAIASLLLVVPACRGGNEHEAMMKDMIKAMNELADVLESIKDEATAKAAEPKLKALGTRIQEMKKKADALGGLPKDKDEELRKKYEPEMNAAVGRIMAASQKAASVPEAQAALQEAFKSMGQP
jgi:predicted  nucleic acid-binding Zn-ribbon protein